LRHFLHLTAQFFRFTPQLLFLPSLFKRLLLWTLRSQFLLAFGKLFQLLKSFVHRFLLVILLLLRRLLPGFVLVLAGIQFQVEHARQVALRATAAASTATLTEGYFNVTEQGFRPQ
jgi:hypothetical protein